MHGLKVKYANAMPKAIEAVQNGAEGIAVIAKTAGIDRQTLKTWLHAADPHRATHAQHVEECEECHDLQFFRAFADRISYEKEAFNRRLLLGLKNKD